MESLKYFINREIMKYPKMEIIDIYKLIYQSYFLTNHFITDEAYFYLLEEIKISKKSLYLYEYISDEVVRLNLNPYFIHFDIDELFKLFKNSQKIDANNFYDYLIDNTKSYNSDLINQLVEIYNEYKNNPISHSIVYKNEYNPSYRLIKSNYLTIQMRLYKLNEFINKFRNLKTLKIICVEGRICSGKTTLTNLLNDVCIINCDDHFAMQDPLDYDYLESLLSSLHKGIIKEKCYNCQTKTYYYKEKEIKDIVIVEGSFSYHNKLRKYYDALAYCITNNQLERLKYRESKENYHNFINKWIPREKEYYDEFNFIEIADILI